jgi:hypothetical protein
LQELAQYMPGWQHVMRLNRLGEATLSRYIGPAGEVLTREEFAAEVVRRSGIQQQKP